MNTYDLIVVGAGAAGLLAAGFAARAGAQVLLIEKMPLPARKLRISGKGRANLTNTAPLNQFLAEFAAGNKFLRQAFNNFFTPKLLEFFNSIGVETISERGGRIFAAQGGQAVVDALWEWVKQAGVKLAFKTTVSNLLFDDQTIAGVEVDRSGQTHKYYAKAVIVATGGASYPLTGSTGDGYRLAMQAGHRLVRTRPALVPLVCSPGFMRPVAGLGLKNVAVYLYADNKRVNKLFGEIGFTFYGLDGPLALSLSRQIGDLLHDGADVQIGIDLKPALDDKVLEKRLQKELLSKQRLSSILKNLLPQDMISWAMKAADIPVSSPGNQVRKEQRKKLRLWFKDIRVNVTGLKPIEEAIVTAGGVDTKQVDPRTMESLLCPGLFLVGELLDIDANTGGYNLAAAFATGKLAGESAIKYCIQAE